MDGIGAATVFGMINNIGQTMLNNNLAAIRTEHDRRENFKYGEMGADAADRRTRALYADLYSPAAMLKQYQEAGLSPSVMYGGMPGGGGTSGASAAGAASEQTPFMPMSLLEGAQIGNLIAQTQKTKAETKNISKDTELKELERQMSEMTTKLKQVEFDIATTTINMDDGSQKSIYELATEANDYESLLKQLREIGNDQFNNYAASEAGQRELRKIYLNAQRFETDINILSSEKVSAKFQQSVLNALNKEGFAEQNAKTAIKQLKAAAEVSDLTAEQKGAWNNLIQKLEKKNSTAKDILIVAGMILANYMHGSGVQINTGDKYFVKKE